MATLVKSQKIFQSNTQFIMTPYRSWTGAHGHLQLSV
jgi:hypothetical protein